MELRRGAARPLLWLALTAALGLRGGRFGRRAGMRGALAAALAAGAAGCTPAARAQRNGDGHRSGSSPPALAAQFAFAAGASLEMPALAAPLAALAGSAALATPRSARRPLPVLSAVGLGAAAALASRRFWPLAPRGASAPNGATPVPAGAPSADGGGLTVVVNPSAGPALGGDPADALSEELPGAQVVQLDDGGDLGRALELAATDATAIGVAGGDGSVNTAAAVAHAHGKPLVIVPAGTLNHLARDLGVDSVDDAAASVRARRSVAVDVAEIAGQPFLNTASFGSYAELVDTRERLENRIGKWPALVIALVKVLRNGRPVRVEINGRERRLWMIFVGNCCYQPSGFAPSWRERMDDGNLDVRIVDAGSPWCRLRLIAAVLTGTLPRCGVYEQRIERELVVRSLDGPLRLARDGETFDGPSDFVVSKRPEPLAVLVPDV